jgi:hypothetical protein
MIRFFVAAAVVLVGVFATDATAQVRPNIINRGKPVAPPSRISTDSDDGDSEMAEEAGEPVDPEIVRLSMMDGSLITGKLSIKELEVETPFGKLTVPISELKSFTPGLVSHPELAKQIHDLIDGLAAPQFDTREKSQRALMKMGVALRGELEKRRHDPDTERRARIKAILDEWDEQSEADDEDEKPATPSMQERDQVETSEFTAVGRIVNPTLAITSLYGPLTVKLSDVRRGQRDVSRRADLRKTVGVDGSCLVTRVMKDTKVRLERGDRVTITAEGSIAMVPWGNGATSGPDGAGNYGWYIPQQIPSGALVGVIGSGESVFKLGSKSSFKAEKNGVLRLGIAMQTDYANQNFPGRYTVKIHVEPRR